MRTTYIVPRTRPMYPEQRNSYRKCNKIANISVKKLQFRQELTANDTSKTAKITKRWYYSTAHWHVGDVLVGNHLYVISAVLDVSFAVNSCLNRSFFTFINWTVTIPSSHCVTGLCLVYWRVMVALSYISKPTTITAMTLCIWLQWRRHCAKLCWLQ